MATLDSLNEKEIVDCQIEIFNLQKELDALDAKKHITFAERQTFATLKERFAELQERLKLLAERHKKVTKDLAKIDQIEVDILTDPIESQIENVRRIKRKLDMNLPLSESEAASMNGFLETFRTMVHANAPELLRRRALTILLDRAMTESTITYEDLARRIGVPHSGNALGRALTPILTHILNWCQDRGMPPLTALVVRKSGTTAGLPSPTYFQLMGVTAPTKAGKEFLKKLHASHLDDIRQFFSLTLTQSKQA
jgi:hypothetical protein